MAATQTETQVQDERPYKTEVDEGEEITLVLFIPSAQQFYEPLPDGHPDVDEETALTMRDPRTGDLFEYQAGLERYLQMSVGNHIVGLMPVERWADFRETYVEADQVDVNRAREQLAPIFE